MYENLASFLFALAGIFFIISSVLDESWTHVPIGLCFFIIAAIFWENNRRDDDNDRRRQSATIATALILLTVSLKNLPGGKTMPNQPLNQDDYEMRSLDLHRFAASHDSEALFHLLHTSPHDDECCDGRWLTISTHVETVSLITKEDAYRYEA